MRVEKPTTTTVHTRVFCRVCQKVGEDKTSLKFSKLLNPLTILARLISDRDSRKTVTIGMTIMTAIRRMLGSIHR